MPKGVAKKRYAGEDKEMVVETMGREGLSDTDFKPLALLNDGFV